MIKMYYLVKCDKAEFTKLPNLIHVNFYGEGYNVQLTEVWEENRLKYFFKRVIL